MIVKSALGAVLPALSLPSAICADVLSGLGIFNFVNSGVTITRNGSGFELSAGRNGIGSDEALLLGGLMRYEPEANRKEIGMEFGMLYRMPRFIAMPR